MIDLESVKKSADLLAICGRDTDLKKVSMSGGGEYAGACPFCGGRDRFRLQPAGGRWLCHNCTDGKWHDVIEYIGRRDNLNRKNYAELTEICKRATGTVPTTSTRQAQTPPIQPAYIAPGEAWQTAARQVLETCKENLWSERGRRALDYLHGRGLTDQTIKRFSLGYSPGETLGGLWVERGIIIPCVAGGEIWYLKIRRPAGEPKYICVKGSRPAAFYNADDLLSGDLALFCEGEFDCMVSWQELRGELACVTLGSATNSPDLASWGAWLLNVRVGFLAYDTDQAGTAGAERLAAILGRRAVRVELPPGNKDINDYHQAGGDLWAWLKPYLDQYDPID